MNSPSLKTIFRAITFAVFAGCATALAAAGLFIAHALTRSVAPPKAATAKKAASLTVAIDAVKELMAASDARRGRPQPSAIANPFVIPSPQQPPAP